MKVKEFANIINGATPSSSNPDYYDGDIIWYTPKDLAEQKQKYISRGARNITQLGYESCSTNILPAGSVLMSSRAPIGLLAISTVDFCTNQGFKCFEVNKNLCNPEYLYYFLKYHIKEIELLGSGTTFQEVSKSALEEFDIPLPTIKEQEKIISILSSLDSKISLNRSIISELESLAKQIYDYWFVQFDFPDEHGRPYKSSGGKMVWNEKLKRHIPAAWEVKKLGDVCTFRNGVNYGKSIIGEKDYRIINVRNITESSLLIDSSKLDFIRLPVKLAEKYLVSNHDIIIARSGSPCATRLFIENKDDVIFCGFIICCSPIEERLKLFIAYTLKRLEHINLSKSTGSVLSNVCQDFLKGIVSFIPPQKIIERFNQHISTIHLSLQNTLDENRTLTSLRDFLLPMLMNGQVTVK